MDNDAAGCSSEQNFEEEHIFNVKDILDAEEELMEEAAAVLGDGDDVNCTYDGGYIKRQVLYACLTCIPEAKDDFEKSAGVCLACSLLCHDGHTMVELYTKRHFRCDCGNDRFPNFSCGIQPMRSSYNEENKYNHNFSGLYCTCSKPYPDPEDKIEDEMTQCIMCEDWYHSRHLGTNVPDDYAEMICENCVRQHEFLLYYDGLMITQVEDDGNVNNATDEVNVVDGGENNGDKIDHSISNLGTSNDATAENAGASNENGTNSSDECIKPKIKSTRILAKFTPDAAWRNQLCKCALCMQMYENEKVTFLLDPEDTLAFHEAKGKIHYKNLQEKVIQDEQKFLNSLDRVALIETISAFNEFRDELSEYLKKFAETKRVLMVADVNEFFSQLKARKRAKTEVQYYCR